MPNSKTIETPESLFKKREKRRWQIALRRYIIERNPSAAYARYFGLDIEFFREWISIQFKNGLCWENFADKWQFDHIVPVAYFDFNKEEDLLLCWNFINIRVENLEQQQNFNRIDIIGARAYFTDLYNRTKYPYCTRMLEKISSLEAVNIERNTDLEAFIIKHRTYFDKISALDKDDFYRLNQGLSFDTIIAEKEIARKFGGG